MKLKYTFEIVEIADELCAVPVGDNSENLHAVLQLNDVAAKMLKYIAESETPEEVHEKLCADYPEDEKAEGQTESGKREHENTYNAQCIKGIEILTV